MRLTPLLVLSIAPLAAACNSGPRVLDIEVTTGKEPDAMKAKPEVARVVVKGKSDSAEISAEAAPGGSLDFGEVDGDLAYTFDVTGFDGEGNTVLRGRSIGGIVLSGVESDTVYLFAQRLGAWARPPGTLPHSHTHAPAVNVGERYLLTTGGDAPKNAAGVDEYDLFAWAGASGGAFPFPVQTLASQLSYSLQLNELFAVGPGDKGNEGIWFDGSTFYDPNPLLPDGLKSYDEIIGGAAVLSQDDTNRMFVVGATRLDKPTDAVLEIADDLSIKVHRLAYPRAGAAVAWLRDVGLVVIGGSADGEAVELLPQQGTAFVVRDFPADATSGAGAAETYLGKLLLVGGVNNGEAAKTRLLDPRCTSKCEMEELEGATPGVSLTRTRSFTLTKGKAIVVGDEPIAMGMTRSFLIDYENAAVEELPLREPRWGATPVETPNGQLAIVGGMHPDGSEALCVEMYFPE